MRLSESEGENKGNLFVYVCTYPHPRPLWSISCVLVLPVMATVGHLPELLAAVAQFQPRQERVLPHTGKTSSSTGVVHIHDRLSLAWCAAHPVARLAMEMRAAERVVLFDTASSSGRAGESRRGVVARIKDTSALVLASTSALPTEARGLVFAKAKDTASKWRRWLRRLDFAEVNIVDDDADDGDTERVAKTKLAEDHMGGSSLATHRGNAPTASPARRRDCGVETGGLVSVLVSREYLLSGSIGGVRRGPKASCHGPARSTQATTQGKHDVHDSGAEGVSDGARTSTASYVSHRVSSLPTLRQWLNTREGESAAPDLARYLPTGAETDFFLFAAATVTQEWLALPEAATFAPPVECLHADHMAGEAEAEEAAVVANSAPMTSTDSQRHKSKTAAATYVAARFSTAYRQPLSGVEGSPDDVYMYRQLFIADEDAVSRLLLTTSRWWLQRPIGWHELPRACAPSTARVVSRKGTVTPPLHIKLVDDVFSTPLLQRAGTCWLRHVYAVHDALSGAPTSPLPPCAVTRWIERMWGCSLPSEDGPTVVAARPSTWWANLVVVSYALWAIFCCLVACCGGVLRGQKRRPHTAERRQSVGVDPLRVAMLDAVTREDPGQRAALWKHVGATYASQIESLDLSYTSVTGGDLLAMMEGAASATTPHGGLSALRTLDLCGCRRLHRGSPSSSPGTADTRAPFIANPIVRVLQWLPGRSSLGRALALATCTGGLQLINASGSSIDDEALRDLGHVCLLLEATQLASSDTNALSSGVPPRVLRPSLLAMDMSSCEAVTDLNPLSFVGSLLQLLAAFSSVHSGGILYLDGSHYSAVLAELLAPYTANDRHARAVRRLFCGSASDVADGKEAVANDDGHQAARHRLYSLFRSHFYHLDFAYCIPIEDINSLGRQRTLQYVNTSHCRLTDAGVAHLSGPGVGRGALNGARPHHGPPLRVIIAEFCDLLGTLEGLAWLPELKKLYVRSSSLTDEGLAALVTHQSPLELCELSYCPKVEVLSCLSRLPELRTLILDCTEIKRSGVRGLAVCPKLETLSLRCCADFASVGASKAIFDTHVVKIPTLTHYVYEDLIGDEAFREYE